MRLLTIACAAFAFLSVPAAVPAALADDTDAAIADCAEAVGTFLMRRVNQGVTGPESVGRSLLSLTNGGHAFFTDSAAGGIADFQPFSDGRGAWRCVSGDAGTMRFTALILDFTFPTADRPDPLIARLDIEAVYDSSSNALTGKTALGFVPLAGNPMDETQLANRLTYDFTGSRIVLPD